MAIEPRRHVPTNPTLDAVVSRPSGAKATAATPVDVHGLALLRDPGSFHPRPADPPTVLGLQRVHGNAFVGRLIGNPSQQWAIGNRAAPRHLPPTIQRLCPAPREPVQRTAIEHARLPHTETEPRQIPILRRREQPHLAEEEDFFEPRFRDDVSNVRAVPVVVSVQREAPDDPAPDTKPEQKEQEALSKRVQKLEVRAAELRSQLKKKPSFTAQRELERLYKQYPSKVLEKMAATDPWAEKVYNARWEQKTKGDVAAITAGDKKTPNLPHKLEVVVTDENGKLVSRDVFTSGGVQKQQRSKQEQLQAVLESHTEQKALKQVPLKAGQTMIMYGSYPACTGGSSCHQTMQQKANSTGGTIIYVWPGGPPLPGYGGLRGVLFTPPKSVTPPSGSGGNTPGNFTPKPVTTGGPTTSQTGAGSKPDTKGTGAGGGGGAGTTPPATGTAGPRGSISPSSAAPVAHAVADLLTIVFARYLFPGAAEQYQRRVQELQTSVQPEIEARIDTLFKMETARIAELGRGNTELFVTVRLALWTQASDVQGVPAIPVNVIVDEVKLGTTDINKTEPSASTGCAAIGHCRSDQIYSFPVPSTIRQEALRRLRSVSASELNRFNQLTNLLKASSGKVRLAALVNIYKLTKDNAPLHGPAAQHAIPMLRDSEQKIRGVAALALQALGATDAIPFLRKALAETTEENAKNAIQTSLNQLGGVQKGAN